MMFCLLLLWSNAFAVINFCFCPALLLWLGTWWLLQALVWWASFSWLRYHLWMWLCLLMYGPGSDWNGFGCLLLPFACLVGAH